MKNRNSKLLPVLRAMNAFTAPAPAEPCARCNGTGWMYADDWEQGYHLTFKTQCRDCHGTGKTPAPVTCHLCGAVVDGDALDVQTAADGTPRLNHWYCRAHLVAGTERLKAAIREQAQLEGDDGE